MYHTLLFKYNYILTNEILHVNNQSNEQIEYMEVLNKQEPISSKNTCIILVFCLSLCEKKHSRIG